MHTCGVWLLFYFPPSLFSYIHKTCFAILVLRSTGENSRCCKFSKFFLSSQKWKKSSRSDFFWQYLLPQTAIFVPSITRRSSERLWIVWETKKKFHNWENEMQTEGISDTMCLMSGCIDGESTVSSRVFNSNHCHHMKKYLPLYFLTLLLLVGKRKI